MFTTDFMIWKKYIFLFLIVTEGEEVLDCSTEGGVPDPVLLLWGAAGQLGSTLVEFHIMK